MTNFAVKDNEVYGCLLVSVGGSPTNNVHSDQFTAMYRTLSCVLDKDLIKETRL